MHSARTKNQAWDVILSGKVNRSFCIVHFFRNVITKKRPCLQGRYNIVFSKEVMLWSLPKIYPFISINSTSKINVALGGITPPAPASP